MEETPDLAARRPLKSRATTWAGWLAGLLVRSGISPNTISIFSVVFALVAAVTFYGISVGKLSSVWPLFAALMIQARLICNLMDGMVAIEGGKKSSTGDLFNEVPDRIADIVILAGLGMTARLQPWGMHLGWLAASLAVTTACIRMQGANLTGRHEFCGPMAKPHRMALVTGTCFLTAFFPGLLDWVFYVLLIIVAGEIVTLWRRLTLISSRLKGLP